MNQETQVLDYLNKLDISYALHRHPAVNTVDEATAHWKGLDGMHCKNLFLRDKKGRKHFLVILGFEKSLDVKKLNDTINERLSFASKERLEKYLNLQAGSVSLFGLINDPEQHVTVILDADIHQYEKINFHPNINTSTLTISVDDLFLFLKHTGHSYSLIPFE